MIRHLFLVLVVIVLFGIPTNAFAHQLKTDGSIGAILHVDPNDDPVAGQPSNFFFEFKDKNNALTLADCECQVSVSQAGKELMRESLSLTDSTVTYTFPAKGVYVIRVEGKPSFSLSYDVRVAREVKVSATANTTFTWSPLHIIHFILILVVAVYTVYRINIAGKGDQISSKERKHHG